MTKEEITRLTAQRVREWGGQLIEAHATPLLLIGVGHDHAQGEIPICQPEDGPHGTLSKRTLAVLLRGLAKKLEEHL